MAEQLACQKMRSKSDKKRGREQMGVRGDTTDTHSQYTLSHKNALSIIWVRPKGDKGWTDMFRVAEEERRTGKKGWYTEERKMDDRMKETFGEDKVADWNKASQAGFTFICVNQFSAHNLIMSNGELPAWNLRIEKEKCLFLPLLQKATLSTCLQFYNI